MPGHSSAAVFDLDDTLIDTRNGPAALQRVADATGLEVARLDARGKKVEEVLAGVSGLTAAHREAAAAAWYLPDLPPLAPLPGAEEVLAALQGRLWLFLVTRGDPARQALKIERCGLGHRFDEIVIRPIEAPGCKRDDFCALLEPRGVPPARCAVIGDDERDELEHARQLGCLALKVPDVPLGRIAARLEEAGLL